jgi:DNA-binding NarL/FixJ family response regulator
MIYFVDEDFGVLAAYTAELGLRGYSVSNLATARDAFQALWNAPGSDIDLVIVDVMLAPGETVDSSNANYFTAGLDLLRSLSDQNPDVFPRRALLFTAAIGGTRREATDCARELGVEIWDKAAFLSPVEFADGVERLIAERSGPEQRR